MGKVDLIGNRNYLNKESNSLSGWYGWKFLSEKREAMRDLYETIINFCLGGDEDFTGRTRSDTSSHFLYTHNGEGVKIQKSDGSRGYVFFAQNGLESDSVENMNEDDSIELEVGRLMVAYKYSGKEVSGPVTPSRLSLMDLSFANGMISGFSWKRGGE